MPAEKLLQSHQQGQLDRCREILAEDPDAELMTVVVSNPAEGQAAGSPVLDYGGVGPLDLVRIGGYCIRRAIKMTEAIPVETEANKIRVRVLARLLREAIAKLPVDLGEEIPTSSSEEPRQ